MKKKESLGKILLVMLIASSSFVASAQQTLKPVDIFGHDSSANHFTLNGKVPASLNGQKIHLITFNYDSENKVEKAYSAVISNGSFTFNGLATMPVAKAKLYIFNDEGKLSGCLNFIMEAKNNQIIASPVGPQDRLPGNSLSKVSILNSKANYMMRSMDSVETSIDKGGNYSRAKVDMMVTADLKILAHYPNEYYSLLKLYKIANWFDMKGKPEDKLLKAFGSLNPELKSSALGKAFLTETTALRYGASLAIAGKPVQEFSVMTDKGKIFSNSSLKGSPYVIAFSGTWCGTCMLHQPMLLQLYHKYKPRGLKVVYFNVDNGIDKWKKMITDKKLDWTNVSERTDAIDSKISKQFAVYSFPKYFVVDKKGTIVYVDDNLNDVELEKYIQQVVL